MDKANLNNIDKIYNENSQIFAKSYFNYLIEIINQVDTKEIADFIEVLVKASRSKSTVFFIGNGGSAATASHFANDLAIGIRSDHHSIRALSLTDNVPILTAVGNDYGYNEIFLRQLMVLAKPGDVLVGISASGNSPNLINAFEYAKNNKLTTVAITAFSGGTLRKIANHGIHIPTEHGEYGPAEDLHMILDHLIGAYLNKYLNKI